MPEHGDQRLETDWGDPRFLETGTARQRRAWHVLQDLGVLEDLKAFEPIFVGTIPIDVDIADSDIDVICAAGELAALEDAIRASYEKRSGFRCSYRPINGVESLVATFEHDGFTLEIFGQCRPTREQDAYIHMVAEHKLLLSAGPKLKEEVRRLKSRGLKTEPAFATALALQGDPYDAIALLRHADDEQLIRLLHDRGFLGPAAAVR